MGCMRLSFIASVRRRARDVPVVFVSGDEGLCWDVSSLNERITTVAVSSGIGNSSMSIHPHLAVKRIREGLNLR